MAIISILASLLLGGVARVRSKARGIACANNLRQLALGISLYTEDQERFPGGIRAPESYYLWPIRTLPYVGEATGVSWCPASSRKARWDLSSAPRTQGKEGRQWVRSGPQGSRFSYGYNDWGLRDPGEDVDPTPQLGLGGDIWEGNEGYREIRSDRVVAPSETIELGDTRSEGSYDGSLDPKQSDQWPSDRHERPNIVFVDAHLERPRSQDVVNPRNERWRRRWNNDNEPHWEIQWTVPARLRPAD